MATALDFLKKPVLNLSGFQVTVGILLVASILVYLLFFKR